MYQLNATLEEKTQAILENPTMVDYCDKVIDIVDTNFDAGKYDDLEPEDIDSNVILDIVHQIDPQTLRRVCAENLQQNAAMTVDLLKETFCQIQEQYDTMDEDDRFIFEQTMRASMMAANQLWSEMYELIKELIGEMDSTERESLLTNSGAIANYLRTEPIPECIGQWQCSLVDMWTTVNKLAA